MKTQWIVGLIAVLLFGAHRASAQADLSLSLGLDFSGPLPLNYSRLLTLTVSNAGPAMATGVTISSQNPTNVTLYSISAGSVATSPDGLLTIGLGTLPAGQSETFTLRVVPQPQIIASANPVNPVDFLSVPVTNTFTVSANETDPNPANNSASTNFVAQSSFPGSPISNYSLLGVGNSTSNRFNLSFEYNNIQDSVVSYSVVGVDADIFDSSSFFITHYQSGLPGDVVILAGTNASFSATTAMTNWLGVVRFFNPADPTGVFGDAATEVQAFFPFSAINADGFTNFTLFPNVIYVTGTASVTNGFISLAASYGEAAYGVAEELDYYTMDLTASHVPGGLRLNASATPEPVVVGNNLTYSLTVSNAMSRTATGVVISNQFPANVTFVSATGGTVTTNNGVLLINLSSLAPGASESAQVVMQTAIVAPFTNLFRVFCDQPDPDPNNGFAPVFSIVNGVSTVLSADVSVSDTSGYENAEVTTRGMYSQGQFLTYTLMVSNAGPATATGIVISNQYPAATVNFVSATGGTVTTNNGVLLVQLASLAAGATNQVVITMQPTIQYLVPNYSVNNTIYGNPTAQFTNAFEVSADEYDPVAGNNSVTTAYLVRASLPGTPLNWQDPGGSSIYEFTGGGIGVQAFENLYSITNVEPGDAVILINTNGSMSDLINPTNWAAVIRCFNPADPTGALGLPATEQLTYFGGNVPNGFGGFSLFPNTVYLNNASGLSGLTNGFVYATATQFGPLGGIYAGQADYMEYQGEIQPTNADLTLSAVAVPSPVTVGSNLVYSLTVSNGGLWTATDVVISNQLPAGVNFVSATGGATPAGGTLLVNLSSIAVGATASAQVVVQPTATGSLTNVFQVSADQVNFAPTNAIATTITAVNDVTAAAELSLSASGSPGSVFVGSNLVYSLTISNAGPATASGIVISNALPANVHFDFATGVTAVTATGNTLVLNLDPLAAGANELVQITVQPDAAGGITNTFQVSAIQADDNQSNNTATVVSTVTSALFAGPPGTPANGFQNPGGTVVLVGEGGGIGTQPITSPTSGTNPYDAFAGDVVWLLNANNGTATTNWQAVLRFVNPADPTGTNGLAATEYETFFPSNSTPNDFADFTLLPNVIYVLATGTNADGSITANTKAYGPVGSIISGQEAIMLYQASLQPSAGTPPTLAITTPTAGQIETNQVIGTFGTTTVGSSGAAVADVYYQLNSGGWYRAGEGVGGNYTNWESLEMILVPGSNTVQAYCVDVNGLVSATNSVTFDYVVTAGALFAGPPGTPASGFQNPGGSYLAVGEGGGIGAQPIMDTAFGPNPYDALAGDVVWLLNTNNGTATTNWQAVLRFINPAAPTGTNGLAATEYETFFPSNSTPNNFAGFALLPNVIYVPATATNADGSITAEATVIGPVGSINSGQETIILYKASLQPSSGTPPTLAITAPTAGQIETNQVFETLGTTTVGSSGAAVADVYLKLNNVGWYSGYPNNYNVTLMNWTSGVLNLVPGSNTVQAYCVDTNGLVSTTNSVTFDYVVTAGALFAGPPGTPATGQNPGGGTVIVVEGGGIGTQPITSPAFGPNPYDALAGDVVWLLNTNNGTATTNWQAVLRFINPADPTGTNGLAATEYETYFPSNSTPNYFAGFTLLPNVIYVPATGTNANGSITADAMAFGPVGSVNSGQEAIILYKASLQPSATADLSLSPVVEGGGSVGGITTYYLTVTNFGPSTATGVVISNRIPANESYFSASAGTVTTNNGILLVNLGSLAAGAGTNVTIAVYPTLPGGQVTGELTNVFTVSANETDPVLANNSATNITSVSLAIPGTPLTVSGDLGTSSTDPGAFWGSGTVFGTGPIQEGYAPVGSVGVVFSPFEEEYTNAIVLTASAGDLILLNDPSGGNNPTNWLAVVRYFNPADPKGTIGLAATYSEAFFATNFGGAGFANFQLFPNTYYIPNDTYSTTNGVTTLVAAIEEFGPAGIFLAGESCFTVLSITPTFTDLSLGASAAPEPVTAGNDLTYSLSVSNGGAMTATDVIISNQIPAGVNFVSATGGATPTNGILLMNLGSLAVGAAQTAQVVVQPTVTGNLTNVFQVASDLYDPVLTNNTATVVSTVTVNGGIPGTPLTILGSNPGGSTIYTTEFVFGTTPTPIIDGGLNGLNGSFTNLTVEPGDLILLNDPSGGNDPTNWAAVVRYFNPADPTGANGLPATYSEVFLATNLGGNGFAGFTLFTNTDYIPAGAVSSTNGVTLIITTINQVGPAGVINVGQTDINLLTVEVSYTDLSLNASAAPEPVTAGNDLTYSLSVSNGGFVTATDVIISNQIPANVTFVSATGGASPTNDVLLLNLGSIAAGAIGTAIVDVQPTAAGKLTNMFQVSSDLLDPVLSNNLATVVSTVTNAAVVASADLSLSGSVTNVIGQTAFVLSLTVSNAGPSVATGVVISNQIPAGFTFISATGGTVTTNNGILLVNVGSLAVGATNSAQIIMQPTVGIANTNTFQVFGNENDPVPTNNFVTFVMYYSAITASSSSSDVTYETLLAASVDQQSNTFSTELIARSANGTVVYDQTFNAAYSDSTVQAAISQAATNLINAGATSYTGPAQTSFSNTLINTSSVTTASTNSNVSFDVANIFGPGNILIGDLGTYLRFATNSAYTGPTGGNPQTLFLFAGGVDVNALTTSTLIISQITSITNTYLNSSVYVMTGVIAQASADLSLSGSALPEPAGVSSNLVYSLIVSNAGPSAATSVIISNQIPVGVNFVSATGGATPSGGILLVNLGSLAAGATNTAQIIVQPTVTGKFTNLFTVFSSVTDPVLGNNSASVVSTVTNAPAPPVDVALSLVAAPNPVAVGSPLTYSLTVINNSSTTATGVIVSNTLPANVTLFSLLPSQGSATNQAGVVTYSVGSLPNGNAATLAIVVLPQAAGLLTNTAIASSAQTDSQPGNNRVTNITTAVSVPITNLVLTVLTTMTLNPQTGLFEQSVEVANGGPSTPSSVLVEVSGLAANAKLYNATGTTNGLPYVQSATPLGIGSNVIFLLEYYIPTRVMPTNLTYTVVAGPVFIPPVVNGTIMNIDRMIVLANGTVLVEFTAIPGQVYAIQYSSDMKTWQTAVPVITAPANRVQWIDAGPPQTASSPAGRPERYYRVVLLPAK